MYLVRTPCRLHFGLLAFNRDEPRQFGGVGLMIQRPEIALSVAAAKGFSASGFMADRAESFARYFAQAAVERGLVKRFDGAAIEVRSAPRAHTGLGTGTQLGMAIARGMAALIRRDDLGPADLAALVGRGRRSAIGAHGFFTGGLIVEGGKRLADDLSPLLLQMSFPEQWRIVLVSPRQLEGLAGARETAAFAAMAPIPREATAEMCRLVLLGLAPAVLERDLSAFGQSLFQLQQMIGSCFAQSQGGVFAHELLDRIVHFIRDQGISGVGQSSWGPTLYAVTANQQQAEQLVGNLLRHFPLAEEDVTISQADNHGGSLQRTDPIGCC